MRKMRDGEQGVALFTTFLMMLVLSGLALGVGVFSHNSLMTGKSQLQDKQAFYIAEAGLHRARQALSAGTWSAGNTYSNDPPFGAGEYVVTIVDNGGGASYTMTSEGYVPNQTATVARRRVIEADVPVTTGGTNVALSAVASASSSNGANTPERANDCATSTRWECNTEDDCWLQLDFGAATTLNRVIINEQGSRIKDPIIQYSSNGSSWTNVSSQSSSTSGNTIWTVNFTAATQRYFRVFIEESDGRPRIREFEAYDTAGGSSLTLCKGTFRTQW